MMQNVKLKKELKQSVRDEHEAILLYNKMTTTLWRIYRSKWQSSAADVEYWLALYKKVYKVRDDEVNHSALFNYTLNELKGYL